MKQKKKFLALLILGLVIIANMVGTRVFAAHTQENIKVGFFLFPGYHIVDTLMEALRNKNLKLARELFPAVEKSYKNVIAAICGS